MLDLDSLARRFAALAPAADRCQLRAVARHDEQLAVRRDVLEPPQAGRSAGAMVTIVDGDGIGYAATPDLGDEGLRRAIDTARRWAALARGRSVFARPPHLPPLPRVVREVPPADPLPPRAARIELLRREAAAAHPDPRIVDWSASLWTVHEHHALIDADGRRAEQRFDFAIPALEAVAHDRGVTQTRSWGGRYNGFCQQGGADVLARAGFAGSGARTADEALQLLGAPNCPDGAFDLVLMPDQMMLQIHESIGHPLELDRILGDERNYAGTSFVTLDMFGHYRYGSPLLDVTYDPGTPHEFAGFAFDDEGAVARREYLIRGGILLRPLGGGLSGQRAAALGHPVEPVATTRANGWQRPPIDRMSNLNVEPGTTSFADLVAAVEDGILMQTNASWSIDDSRNKFQFGCEWGRRIRGGRLAEVLRNPNYRGISATFWRSLAAVGDAATVETMGTPYCGKGEPNQTIRVGHAAPACRFTGVDVFGGGR